MVANATSAPPVLFYRDPSNPAGQIDPNDPLLAAGVYGNPDDLEAVYEQKPAAPVEPEMTPIDSNAILPSEPNEPESNFGLPPVSPMTAEEQQLFDQMYGADLAAPGGLQLSRAPDLDIRGEPVSSESDLLFSSDVPQTVGSLRRDVYDSNKPAFLSESPFFASRLDVIDLDAVPLEEPVTPLPGEPEFSAMDFTPNPHDNKT